MTARLIDTLLASPEPSLRWKIRIRVLGEAPTSRAITALRKEIKDSPRVRQLLSGRAPDGRLLTHGGVYAKWQGAHWVLAALADLGYPPGDRSLHPMRDQVLETWLSPQRNMLINGLHRQHGSIYGNALRSLTELGFNGKGTADLAERLLHWQWPDGGWNCDRNPDAHTSSFIETLLTMRGLWAHAEATGDDDARSAALRASEVFLARRLLYRASTGELIKKDFAQLHYPLYWHYDLLGGLCGKAELGLIDDPRCADALDLLESLRLPDGWPAQRSYYRMGGGSAGSQEWVDWGGTSTRQANPWVTADVLAVLKAAGRL
jgi:hypothetical protein